MNDGLQRREQERPDTHDNEIKQDIELSLD